MMLVKRFGRVGWAKWKKNHETRVKDLELKIYEKELPQLIRWGIEGARRLHQQGEYSLSPVHGSVIEHWKNEANSVMAWVNERLVQVEGVKVKRSDARKRYEGYCDATGRKVMPYHTWQELLSTTIGIGATKIQGDYYFKGIGIAFDDELDKVAPFTPSLR